ncbi:hypothetical protein [Aeromicrobium sp. Leaf291]|uniref:hypothetical protein n=1 Tax=Aeromicrobium sp. Leaf291 TaxID=1736325 RepID=UPI0006FA9858|nr:hypothetical protein [Aeromicrobium sp. Leaf291]KQP81489.1 hypothetical protein ASF35_15765 [Aeromicrobium sp. Leaf291]
MSRTTLPDGSIRYAPDRGHRAPTTKARRRSSLAAVAVVLPVGLVGLRGIGLEAGLWVVGVTAAVTLLGVVVWRLTLPSQHTVTVSRTHVTFRSYGRTRVLAVDEHLRGSLLVLTYQHGFEVPYLVVDGTGRPFRLNVEMWSEDDLEAIIRHLPNHASAPEPLDAATVEREFPGLLPFSTRHPNRFAIAFVVVTVAVVIAVGVVVTAVTAERDDDEEYEPVATVTPSVRPDLSREAGGRQNRLQADVQRLLGEDDDWSSQDPTIRDCADGGYQRILTWTNDAPRERYTQDDRQDVAAAARRAGLVERDVEQDGEAVTGLSYLDPETLASLQVDVSDGVLTVTTDSACSSADQP